MSWSFTPDRRNEAELMDAPGLPEAEVSEAYRVLSRINQQLGNLRILTREVQRFLSEDVTGTSVVTLLDVGSGSGDLPDALSRRLASRSTTVTALALDRDSTAVSLARQRNLAAVRGDALRLPFAARSIDLVTAVKFAHHFTGTELDHLVAEMTRVARHRVIVLDIRRHWLAYCGFIAWSRVFTRNRLIRYDGPLSVLRGFTAQELSELGEPHRDLEWEVRRYAGFQLALVGRRRWPATAESSTMSNEKRDIG